MRAGIGLKLPGNEPTLLVRAHRAGILQAGNVQTLLTLAGVATLLILAVLFGRRLRLRQDHDRLAAAEAALRASNSTYRSLIDSVTELIYVQDLETGQFLDVNAAVERIYGYSRDEIIGSTPALLADPSRVDLEETRRFIAEAAQGVPQRFEWWGRTKDGHVFPKDVVLVRGEYFGEPVIIAVARDVSERLAAEESARRRTEEYREIFETDLVGNFVGRPDGTLDACNEAFSRMVGYASVEEALSARTSPFTGNSELTQQLLAILDEKGRIEGREIEFRRPDGRVLQILLYARGVYDQGELVRFHGHCLDITEKKAMAERIREAQKLEAVGLLAGGVAHDFNNALTTIQGHAELLLEEVGQGGPLREGIEEIRQSAERAGRLTRQLLAFSRRRVVRPRVVDLASFLRDSMDLLRQLVGENVRLELSTGDAVGTIRADPGEIEQLLINLALNASEALPRGGRVEIRMQDVRVENGRIDGHEGADDRLDDGAYVLLQMADDGVGMDERVQARAFEPFFTTRPHGEGRGLGLATVYGVVQESGGVVWVDSAPGRGATFSICFPRVGGEALGDRSVEPIAVTDVLLAEDEEGVRRLTRRVLEQEGFRVHEAVDGRSALDLAHSLEQRIGLLVTDVVMPEVDGTDVADQLQARDPDLRVLFMSGYTEADALRADTLPPGQAFLSKPFSPSALREAIRELLQQPVTAGDSS